MKKTDVNFCLTFCCKNRCRFWWTLTTWRDPRIKTKPHTKLTWFHWILKKQLSTSFLGCLEGVLATASERRASYHGQGMHLPSYSDSPVDDWKVWSSCWRGGWRCLKIRSSRNKFQGNIPTWHASMSSGNFWIWGRWPQSHWQKLDGKQLKFRWESTSSFAELLC